MSLAVVGPSALNEDWVKQSSNHSSTGLYYGYRLFDDAIPVTGGWDPSYAWIADNVTYGRVNVRLPSPARVAGFVVHNGHHNGNYTEYGSRAFTFWGSNSADAFAATTWNADTGWTQLLTSVTEIPRHVAANISDPTFVSVENEQDFLYYAIRVSSSWGGSFVSLKKLTLLADPKPGLVAFAPISLDTNGVKATTRYDTGPPDVYYAHMAFDTSLPLNGDWAGNAWIAVNGTTTNQRVHVDLGVPRLVSVIHYHNAYHPSGSYENCGAKDFTFWGSNSSSDFNDLVYANDGTWEQIATARSSFQKHIAANEGEGDADFIPVPSEPTPFRYYAFKVKNNWGGPYLVIRRLGMRGYAVAPGGSLPPLPMRGRPRMR